MTKSIKKHGESDFFAPCAQGLEYLLRDELISFGIVDAHEGFAGVKFHASFQQALYTCLHSRLASRITQVIKRFVAEDATDLYDALRDEAWVDWIGSYRTFAIDVTGSIRGIAHTNFAAMKVKDAITDAHRNAEKDRPNVDTENPDVQIRLHLHPKECVLMWDLCGAPLHERGWRVDQGEAPIKETLAAAMLIRAGWPQLAAGAELAALIDPMCGAGTILIEGVWMKAGVAPGLMRAKRGGFAWRCHPEFQPTWETDLIDAAQAKADAGLKSLGTESFCFGYEADPKMIAVAKRNLQSAGVAGFVRLNQADAAHIQSPTPLTQGVVLTNPPYGERMGDVRDLVATYRALGQMLHSQFADYTVALISSSAELLSAVNLPIKKRYQLKNGALDCTLALYDATRAPKAIAADAAHQAPNGAIAATPHVGDGGKMVINRIEKNQRRLKSYLTDQKLGCYRVYDADLPEYAAAIDVYGDRLHIQEYLAPATIPEDTAIRRLNELVRAAEIALAVPREKIALKTRRRDKGGGKYRRDDRELTDDYFEVQEGKYRFWVNLDDYLDTGLFLDSRSLRQRIERSSRGKRVLNLFCYTASASVYAAGGGANETVSVDLSPVYLNWASQNFELNAMDLARHHLVQADAVKWLEGEKDQFDLIYLDPPTFSNSKRTDTVLDIQRDHEALIAEAMRRLKPDGELIFVTNAQKFKISEKLTQFFVVDDFSQRSIPPDFERNGKIHRAYSVRLPKF